MGATWTFFPTACLPVRRLSGIECVELLPESPAKTKTMPQADNGVKVRVDTEGKGQDGSLQVDSGGTNSLTPLAAAIPPDVLWPLLDLEFKWLLST